MMRPYPRCFNLEDAAMLAAALYAQLLTPHIPGPRLPLQARRDLAGRCTALCQAAHIRAYESIVIGEALVSACCGWTGPAEGAADSVAAALVHVALCVKTRQSPPVVTQGSIIAFLITFLSESLQAWEQEKEDRRCE